MNFCIAGIAIEDYEEKNKKSNLLEFKKEYIENLKTNGLLLYGNT